MTDKFPFLSLVNVVSTYKIISCASYWLIVLPPSYLWFCLSVETDLKEQSMTFVDRLILKRLHENGGGTRRRCRLNSITTQRVFRRLNEDLTGAFGLSNGIHSGETIHARIIFLVASIFD